MTQSLLTIGAILLLCAGLIAGMTYLFGPSSTTEPIETDIENLIEETQAAAAAGALKDNNYEPAANTNRMNPTAIITTNYGVIELELFDDAMPITAGNFMNLAKEGFYDGTKFHRVIDGFMIQGGDPITKTDEVMRYGTGGPGYAIPDEHIAGEKLTNVRGTISMANSGPETGGSQFFINTGDNSMLDFDKAPLSSKHPVFGQVISGMDVVDTIGTVATGPSDQPLDPVVVESVVIRQ